MHFFTTFPDDWLSGTADLSCEESGAYWNLICFYMLKDGQVPDRADVLARVCKLSKQRFRRVRETLIDGGFIEVRDGFIWQAKCEERLKKDGVFSRKQREKAQKRWRQKQPKSVENNDTENAIPAPAPAPNKKNPCSPLLAPEDEPDSRREYAFEGAVICLTPDAFKEWRTTYHGIPDIDTELRSIDAWCAGKWPEGSRQRTKWCGPVSNMLNKTHQKLLAAKANDPAAEYWAGIERGEI